MGAGVNLDPYLAKLKLFLSNKIIKSDIIERQNKELSYADEEKVIGDRNNFLFGDCGILWGQIHAFPPSENPCAETEQKSCLQCKLNQKFVDSQIDLLPDLFNNFKNKLTEEGKFETAIKDQIKNFEDRVSNFTTSVENNFVEPEELLSPFENFTNKLLETISGLKNELDIFANPTRVKSFTDSELDLYFKLIKRVFAAFQEEKIRRKVIQEMGTEGSAQNKPAFVQKNRVQAESDEFQALKSAFFEKMNKMSQKVQTLKTELNLTEIVSKMNDQISSTVDSLFNSNYEIQKQFWNCYEKLASDIELNKKKFEWFFSEQRKPKVADLNKKDPQKSSSKLRKNQSSINLSPEFYGDISEEEIKEREEMNQAIVPVLERFKDIGMFSKNIEDLKQLAEKNYAKQIIENMELGRDLTQGLEPVMDKKADATQNLNSTQNANQNSAKNMSKNENAIAPKNTTLNLKPNNLIEMSMKIDFSPNEETSEQYVSMGTNYDSIPQGLPVSEDNFESRRKRMSDVQQNNKTSKTTLQSVENQISNDFANLGSRPSAASFLQDANGELGNFDLQELLMSKGPLISETTKFRVVVELEVERRLVPKSFFGGFVSEKRNEKSGRKKRQRDFCRVFERNKNFLHRKQNVRNFSKRIDSFFLQRF